MKICNREDIKMDIYMQMNNMHMNYIFYYYIFYLFLAIRSYQNGYLL
jgi:hypothetical protein